MYYLYILYSSSSDKYYVGQSDDPWQRLISHNNSDRITYTSKHRPWELVTVFEVGISRSNALKLERFIKKQKSRSLIEKLVSTDFIPSGELAQLVRVPHI